VYDYVVLHFTYTTIRIGLFVVAATFWILYFHEVLFRSGRIRTQWLKRRFTDLALLLLIASSRRCFFSSSAVLGLVIIVRAVTSVVPRMQSAGTAK
jgi:hypothetical protein